MWGDQGGEERKYDVWTLGCVRFSVKRAFGSIPTYLLRALNDDPISDAMRTSRERVMEILI